MNTNIVSNSLDLDQDQCYFSPDLGPVCLQRLSAHDKSGGLAWKELTLKEPITTAADDKFFNIFRNFRKKISMRIVWQQMILMKYALFVIFEKAKKI